MSYLNEIAILWLTCVERRTGNVVENINKAREDVCMNSYVATG